MDLLSPELANYAEEHTSAGPSYLSELQRETHLKVLYPQMLSGHLQGRVLSFVSKMIQPKRILEIGTYTGYSCLCMAEGLEEGGEIVTIEIDPERKEIISRYLKAADITQNVDLRFGSALDIIPALEGEFDLVFLDADKREYATYYDLILPKVRKGGIILADNVLWSGKVLDHGSSDKDALALQAFNEKIMADSSVENLLLPVRDGIMVMRKVF